MQILEIENAESAERIININAAPFRVPGPSVKMNTREVYTLVADQSCHSNNVIS